MMGPEGAWGSQKKTPKHSNVACPMNLYIYCEDVDAQFKRATTAGAEIVFEPTDMFWGDRACCLTDQDGYTWTFATNVGEFDPSKIPAN